MIPGILAARLVNDKKFDTVEVTTALIPPTLGTLPTTARPGALVFQGGAVRYFDPATATWSAVGGQTVLSLAGGPETPTRANIIAQGTGPNVSVKAISVDNSLVLDTTSDPNSIILRGLKYLVGYLGADTTGPSPSRAFVARFPYFALATPTDPAIGLVGFQYRLDPAGDSIRYFETPGNTLLVKPTFLEVELFPSANPIDVYINFPILFPTEASIATPIFQFMRVDNTTHNPLPGTLTPEGEVSVSYAGWTAGSGFSNGQRWIVGPRSFGYRMRIQIL